MDHGKIRNIIKGNLLSIRKPKDRQKIEELCYLFAVVVRNDLRSYSEREECNMIMRRLGSFVDYPTYNYLINGGSGEYEHLLEILVKKNKQYNFTLTNISQRPRQNGLYCPAILQKGYKIERFANIKQIGFNIKLA